MAKVNLPRGTFDEGIQRMIDKGELKVVGVYVVEPDFEYEDMPSNEQRLDYLDNPHRLITSVKDFNYRVILTRKYADEKKTRLGLLQSRSKEDEVS